MKNDRNEWKYCISERKAQVLFEQLADVLEMDPHSDDSGSYQVSSLYFDDICDSEYFANDAGENTRCKYRIRRYGADSEHLYLERKKKFNAFCYKEKCALTREEYETILDGEYERLVFTPEKPLLSRFCTEAMCKGFRPTAIVNYGRTALVDELCRVRITFDREIRTSYDYREFLSGDYCEFPVLKDGRVVLEFKFDEAVPLHVRRILQTHSLARQAFSKYYRSRAVLHQVVF